MNIEGKQVLVVGSGISGIGAVNLLSKVGAKTILFDANESIDVSALRRNIAEGISCEIRIGTLSEEEKNSIDLVVLSPGVPTDNPFVTWFYERKIPIWGEIELAYRFSKGSILAITGTNGKTTTTALLGQIMKDYFKEVYVVGNIGNPYTEIALETTKEAVTVVELSSFQLETTELFHPKVSAILNITPDHLNRHKGMENYVRIKALITKEQTKEDICVLNYEDEYTRKFGEITNAKPFYFSVAQVLEEGIYLEGEEIVFSNQGRKQRVLNRYQMNLLGIHNVENVMAAIAMAIHFGVPIESVVKTVKAFQSVEHRMEYVATKQGVDYYNDSKGTNPDAAIKAIKAMNKPTVLIGGGYDKGSSFEEWIESFDGKVKCLVLLGQTKEKIASCAKQYGVHPIVLVETLKEAVTVCEEKANPGDAVLLSPACASWGMFPNYEARGKLFKEFVKDLKE